LVGVEEEGCAEEDGEDGSGGDRGAVTPLIGGIGESWGLLAVKSEDGLGNERRHFERPILMGGELLSSKGKQEDCVMKQYDQMRIE
jgi:hypothetical protein